MFSWPSYSIRKAEENFNKLTPDNVINPNLKTVEFEDLRNNLLDARDEIFERHNFDSGINNKYLFDLEFGLALYGLLNDEIDNRDIYKDDIWTFLSVEVIPDVVHARWGLDARRYFKMSRRIYLKQIWWYIHLSWHTDEKTTYNILKNNSTDTIQAMVERPGLGYHIEMYREIMNQYAGINDIKPNEKRLLLRRVMVLNTARSKSVAAELVENGIEGYVGELFKGVL